VSFQKCKPFSLIPFAPFSFLACLCFEAQHLKSVDRPSVLPLRTLTALLLAQLRLRNPTARSPLPPLVFSLPAHARCNLLAPTGPTADASPPRSLPPPLPVPGGAHISSPTSRRLGAGLESSLGRTRAHVRLAHASAGVARMPRRHPSAYLRIAAT
jgi:hypothetical protein